MKSRIWLLLLILLLSTGEIAAQSQLTGFYPTSGYRGTQVNLLITGQNTSFSSATGAMIHHSPTNTYYGSFVNNPPSNTEMSVRINIGANAPLGGYTVQAHSWSWWKTAPGTFTVLDPPTTGGVVLGHVSESLDGNCSQNVLNEPDRGNIVIEALPGPHYAVTDINGNYSMLLPSGTYTLNAVLPDHHDQLCPANGHTITINNTSLENSRDFYLIRQSVTDVRACILTNPHRPGFNTTNILRVENLGGVAANNVMVEVDIPSTLTYVSATGTATQINSHKIGWNVGTIAAGDRVDYQLQINSPINAPFGAFQTYNTTVTTTSNDVNTANNSCNAQVEITGSYDPNDKRVWTEAGLNADGRISTTD
ncbi:MAG: hypothetical protein AAF570_22250, partial [Bacteroidota bacterium]